MSSEELRMRVKINESSEEEKLEYLKTRWNALCTKDGIAQLFENTGYMTIGYYYSDEETSVGQSVRNMTKRLCEAAGVTADSNVLDLGCGRGGPALDIASSLGCLIVGVDLADGNIEMCRKSLSAMSGVRAEFHVGSYFSLPAEVTQQRFSHVLMQTSIFYAHHRIDDVLGEVSRVLAPGGILATTDFLRVTEDPAELASFQTWNSMSVVLTLEEMKAALARNGLQYTGGENLDKHCVRCNDHKMERTIKEGIEGPKAEFFKCRSDFVSSGKVTFQIVIAKKI